MVKYYYMFKDFLVVLSKRKKMIDKLLKTKHWVLFIFTFLIPQFISMLVMGIWMMSFFNTIDIESNTPPDMSSMVSMMYIIIPIATLPMLILYLWMYGIGTRLQDKIPSHLRSSTQFFKIAMIVLVVSTLGYLILNLSFMHSVFDMVALENIENFDEDTFMFSLIGNISVMMLLGLIMFGFSIYIYVFTARTFKTCELQQKVTFGDYVGEFFLLMFWFIGIWIIQPKVNRFMEEDWNDEVTQQLVED